MLQTGSSQPNDTAMEMIGILLANGADLNNRSINGEAPLDILNAYAADILGFNTLKNFFRGLITDIDTRVVFLEHE
jgi:ankyrin repeat protein